MVAYPGRGRVVPDFGYGPGAGCAADPAPAAAVPYRSRTQICPECGKPALHRSCGLSSAWPGVTAMFIGNPRPSTARWISVVNPPRDRPRLSPPTAMASTAALQLFFPGPCRVLMAPDDAGVNADYPLHPADGVGFDHRLAQDPVPNAIRGPAPQPLMCGLPGAAAAGHPRRTRPQPTRSRRSPAGDHASAGHPRHRR